MRSLILCSVIAALLAANVQAQIVEALPLGGNANIAQSTTMAVDAAVFMSGDNTGVGVRGQYKLDDSLAVYGALALPEEGVGFSGGGLYALPLDLPVAVAARAGMGFWSWSESGFDARAIDLHAGALVSGDLRSVVPGLGFYGNVLFHVISWEVDYDASVLRDSDDTETAFNIGGGVTYAVTDLISVFGGIDVMMSDVDLYDETFIGGGVRVGFGDAPAM